jgi:hypothetical protein
MADKLLQNRSQSEKPTRGRGGQVAAPKLQALQFGERQQSDRGRVAGGRRQHGDDLQGAEEAQHAAQFLQGAVVAKVRDVGAQVINGRFSSQLLELLQRLQARLHVMQSDRVELEHQRAVQKIARLLLDEAGQQLQVPVPRNYCHSCCRSPPSRALKAPQLPARAVSVALLTRPPSSFSTRLEVLLLRLSFWPWLGLPVVSSRFGALSLTPVGSFRCCTSVIRLGQVESP